MKVKELLIVLYLGCGALSLWSLLNWKEHCVALLQFDSVQVFLLLHLLRLSFNRKRTLKRKTCSDQGRFPCGPISRRWFQLFLPKEQNYFAIIQACVRPQRKKKKEIFYVLFFSVSCFTIYHNGKKSNDQNVSWWFFSVPFFWWISLFTFKLGSGVGL